QRWIRPAPRIQQAAWAKRNRIKVRVVRDGSECQRRIRIAIRLATGEADHVTRIGAPHYSEPRIEACPAAHIRMVEPETSEQRNFGIRLILIANVVEIRI